MEILIYIANGMNLLGYCMKDILRLRLMMLAAASCLAAYFYTRPDPLMTVVYWNLFYVGLNLFQIAQLLRARLKSAIEEPQVRDGIGGEATVNTNA
jgi:hypothetical protein